MRRVSTILLLLIGWVLTTAIWCWCLLLQLYASFRVLQRETTTRRVGGCRRRLLRCTGTPTKHADTSGHVAYVSRIHMYMSRALYVMLLDGTVCSAGVFCKPYDAREQQLSCCCVGSLLFARTNKWRAIFLFLWHRRWAHYILCTYIHMLYLYDIGELVNNVDNMEWWRILWNRLRAYIYYSIYTTFLL